MRIWQAGALAIIAAVMLFGGMLAFQELGWRYGRRPEVVKEHAKREGSGLMDNAIFGLLGLLIGFTFSGATSRFDQRRLLVGKEVNAIGTAWQRIDALPSQRQDSVRVPFRRYVDALLVSYNATTFTREVLREPPAVAQAQQETWTSAVRACVTKEGDAARMLLLPGLNDMFGAVEEERFARRVHPPLVIFVMLGLTALAAALLAGFAIAATDNRDWIHRIGVAAVISLAVYIIFEMEYPRLGLIRVGDADQALVDLRSTMK
jgi:MFS family permease